MPAETKAFIRNNCEVGSVTIQLGRGSHVGWGWERGNPAAASPYPDFEAQSGGAGVVIRNSPVSFGGSVDCQNFEGPERHVPVPDFEATAVFAIDYLEPDSIRQVD